MRAPALVALLLVLPACVASRPEAAPAPPATVTYPDEPAPPSEPASAPTPPASTYQPAPAPVYEPAPPSPTYAPSRQVDGFRVQIYASDTPSGAEQARSEAETWWSGEQRRTGFVAPLDAYVLEDGGLHKVRMGAFTSRADAEAALATVRTRFPDAFLVPDRVTVDG